jgi:hypothetical protein
MSISGVNAVDKQQGVGFHQPNSTPFEARRPQQAPVGTNVVEVIDSSGELSEAQINKIVATWKEKGESVRNKGNLKGSVVDLALPLVVKKSSAEAPRRISPQVHFAPPLANPRPPASSKPPGLGQSFLNLVGSKKDNA